MVCATQLLGILTQAELSYNTPDMSNLLLRLAIASTLLVSGLFAEEGYVDLWDGKTLNGWQLTTDNPTTFKIVDGALVANGPRAHLFYVGDVNGGKFKNFDLKVDVLAKNNSNGGIYFHTQFQTVGWPDAGFEVQVNNTFVKDKRKTGGLYAVLDNEVPPAGDDEWFTERVVVQDKLVKIYVNDKLITEWTQPDGWNGVEPAHNGAGQTMPGRKLGVGTFALQGHDPGSTVMYKNIRVKVLD